MVFWFSLYGLIIVDIVLITIAMCFNPPEKVEMGIRCYTSNSTVRLDKRL